MVRSVKQGTCHLLCAQLTGKQDGGKTYVAGTEGRQGVRHDIFSVSKKTDPAVNPGPLPEKFTAGVSTSAFVGAYFLFRLGLTSIFTVQLDEISGVYLALMSTSPRGQAEGEDMPLSRCIYCQERTSSSKTICNYCGYLKSIPQPKTGSSIPFLVTLTIVLSLGFYIASSRSYDSYCDPAISQAADDNPAIAGYCSPLTAR